MLESNADKQGISAYTQYSNLVQKESGSQRGKLSYIEFRQHFFDENFDIKQLVKDTVEGKFL